MTTQSTEPRSAVNANPADSSIIAINAKVTKAPAVEMLRLSGFENTDFDSLDVLDNACGGGVVSWLVLDSSVKSKLNKIVAGDIDDNMLTFVNDKIAARPDAEHAAKLMKTEKIDQQAVSLPDESFSHVFSNMGVFFSVSDEAALSETYRLLKPNGVAGFTSWLSIAWFDAIALPALAAHVPEPPVLPNPSGLFPNRGWNEPAAVRAKLEKAGFGAIEVEEYKFTPEIEPEDFAKAMNVLVHVVAKRFWSEEDFSKYGPQVEGALLRYLKETFTDGKWDGKMTAIVSVGKKGGK